MLPNFSFRTRVHKRVKDNVDLDTIVEALTSVEADLEPISAPIVVATQSMAISATAPVDENANLLTVADAIGDVDIDDDDDDPIGMSYSKIMRFSCAKVAAPLACEENIYEDVDDLRRSPYDKLLLQPADQLTHSMETLNSRLGTGARPKKRQAPPPPLPVNRSTSVDSLATTSTLTQRSILQFIPDMLKK